MGEDFVLDQYSIVEESSGEEERRTKDTRAEERRGEQGR